MVTIVTRHLGEKYLNFYLEHELEVQLERFIDSIMTTIKQEEAKLCQEQEEDKWPWIRELITVLVYYEILKRRNKKKKYYLF